MNSKMPHHLRYCLASHPDQNCNIYQLTRYPDSILNNLSIYIPVHLVSFLMNSRKQVKKNPKQALLSLFVGLSNSMAFTTIMIMFMRAACCYIKHEKPFQTIPWLIQFIGSFTLYFESQSRAHEITLYLVPRFLDMVINYIQRRGLKMKFKNGDMITFGIVIAILNYFYQNDKKCIRPTFLKAFDQFWGKN
ncbi:hypothetical protein pb186bvf_012963 [Paramecium bursaria]